MAKWVTSTAHPPLPKHLPRLPKLDYKTEYEPSYQLPQREWITLPVAPATTTVATRREWFRLMFWNVMTDCWTPHTPRPQRSARTIAELEAMQDQELPFIEPFCTDPIANVKPKVPHDQIDWMHRSCKIVDEVLYHDADVLLLNEVNRLHFNTSLWKMLRMQGYGALYVSTRHEKPITNPAQNLNGDDAKNPHVGKLQYEQDVGNAIFFHKGRFFPYFLPGIEVPNKIPYMSVVGLRDRATNMTIMCVVVQLTAGDDAKAIAAREWEANCILRVVDSINGDSSDRGFTGTVIVGDFNNCDPDEPCVAMLRDRYFSAYDAVGGTRWTTWYHTDVEKPWVAPRHLHPTWEARNFEQPLIESKKIVDEVKQVMKERATKKRLEATASGGQIEGAATVEVTSVASTAASEAPASEAAAAATDDSLAQIAAFALQEKQNMLELRKKGIVKRTSDYVFFDESVMSTLRVLDTPHDSEIDPNVLLPNDKIPSHHIPLVVDLCWNDFAPKPVQREKGERK